jgi:hypothetical protein
MNTKDYYTQPQVALKSFGPMGEELTLNSMSPGLFSSSFYSKLFINSLERISPADKVVSCGVGLGRLEAAFLNKPYIKELVSIDISHSILDNLQPHPKLKKIQGDMTQLSKLIPPTKSWFICNEVIADLPIENNHNIGAIQFLHELKKVMLPGSLAVITEYGYSKLPMRLKLKSHTEYSINTQALLSKAQKLFPKVQLFSLYKFFELDNPVIRNLFLKEHSEKYLKMNDQLMLSKIFPELKRPTLFSEKELSQIGVTANVLNSKKISLLTYDQMIKYYYPFFALLIRT